MTLLLFDVDGTILIGNGAGARAMTRAGLAACGEGFTLEGIVISGGMDPVIFAEAARNMGLENHGAHHDAFRDLYLAELERELASGTVLLPGIATLLASLAGRTDITLGLVTGNYQRAVALKFAAVGLGLDAFVLGAFGDEAPTRPGLVALALERYRTLRGTPIEPARVIVIGDTPRDVQCAQQNGCRAFAVATGKYAAHELRDAGADYVVKDLADHTPLLILL
jgi:phosphoglycolate phosphatase-like HAD superfamily hydrolase